MVRLFQRVDFFSFNSEVTLTGTIRGEAIMVDRDLRIAEELKSRVTDVIKLLDFRLFGSRARGDADEYSDLDIFLEVETLDKEQKNKIFDIVWEVGYEHHLVISALIFTRDEIENSPLKSSSIVKSITAEGIRI